MPHPGTLRQDLVTHRVIAILRAVAAERVDMTCSCEPDLFVDGLACCDQYTAHLLVHCDLIRQAGAAVTGNRVRASLTGLGVATLDRANKAA